MRLVLDAVSMTDLSAYEAEHRVGGVGQALSARSLLDGTKVKANASLEANPTGAGCRATTRGQWSSCCWARMRCSAPRRRMPQGLSARRWSRSWIYWQISIRNLTSMLPIHPLT